MFKPSIDDLLKSAIRSILKNKGRTVLTSLGIIIGVTSVILLTSIGNGLKIYITKEFDSLGANSIFIAPGKIFNDKGGFNNSAGNRFVTTNFTISDVNKIEHEFRSSTVIPLAITTAEIKSNKITKSDIAIAGTTSKAGEALNRLPPDGSGRWFTSEEENKKSPVVVLGYTVAHDLFPTSRAIGKKVIVKGKNLKVIGISAKQGSTFGGPDPDNQVYTPIEIVFGINGNQNIAEIVIKTPNKESVPEYKDRVKKLMLKKYDKDAFSVFDSSQLLSSIDAIISTLTIALTGIAAISLVVGGIGIMNIMLVTVTERTREIGLRKAIGAYPRAILLQFLFEAVILSAFGGLLGIIFGTLGTMAINRFFPASVTPEAIALAFGVSSLVGIVFGVTPARKASRLSPIEALRYE
ncbi:MAG TPA: ABC transporter permease [Patescibacteria group bacterium]